MADVSEAQKILKALRLPKQQCNERSAFTLLALAGLTRKDSWSGTQRPMLRIVDIMEWIRVHFDKEYAPNSREQIRRQTIHQFEQARLLDKNPDAPSRPTNSGATNYQLTQRAAEVLKSFGTGEFEAKCDRFNADFGALSDEYRRIREFHKIPVSLPSGDEVRLSPGEHNELQRKIVEEFAPRFAPGAMLLYLGDTADKAVYVDGERLSGLGVGRFDHDKLPDVVLFDSDREWLFLIEAVTSHGPVSPKRHRELEAMLSSCKYGRIYVTAFLDFTAFRRYTAEIVWESEVWIAESPDHMIHYDGQRFLGPYAD